MTKRESILAQIKTNLDGVTAVSGRVYRSRKAAFDRTEFPAILIEPIADGANQTTVQRLTWTLSFHATVITRGDSPDVLADPIIGDVYAAIMGEPTLNGMAIDILPGSVNFNFYDSDAETCSVTSEFKVSYQTDLNDLTKP